MLIWNNQSPKANNYLFKSYGLVSYKVDAYKKNKCLCFNFRHDSMFALKDLRAGILIKSSPKKVKLKVKLSMGDPWCERSGFTYLRKK